MTVVLVGVTPIPRRVITVIASLPVVVASVTGGQGQLSVKRLRP